MASIATSRDAHNRVNYERLTKKDRKKFYAIRSLLIFVYFVFIPFSQAPAWCLKAAEKGNFSFGSVDCDSIAASEKIHYAHMFTFSPILTAFIDILCMIGFGILSCHETTWRNQDFYHKVRTSMMVLAFAVSIADLVFAVLNPYYPYIANMMRAVIVLCFSQGVRNATLSLFSDLQDSIAILLTIFTYILVFVFTVFYFYRPTFEGITNFGSIRDTYRNLTILFTTANYPDIFLPAQRINFWNAFLFMFFMLAGLYFLTNLLTANVFNKYQERLQNARTERQSNRARHIEVIFKKHDHDQSGKLDTMEAKSFLADVFEFDYHNADHRATANNIMKIVGTEDKESPRTVYECKRFTQFFALPNFIEIAGLENLHSLQSMASSNATQGTYEREQWPLERREKGFFDGWMQVVLILLNVLITGVFILNDQFKEVKKI
mmetsp:Transcript_990/g.1557  ORF Transcript_990/g.1557 Transcript_990/m.1557 type:complete len:434 (+) Transcript_990:220-1521(+)